MWLGYFQVDKRSLLEAVLSEIQVEYLIKDDVVFLDAPQQRREFIIQLKEKLDERGCSCRFRPFHEKERDVFRVYRGVPLEVRTQP